MGLAGDFAAKDATTGKQPSMPMDQLARQQALLNSGAMNAGGINPASPPGTSGNPSQGCSTGGEGSATTGAAPVGAYQAEGYDNVNFISKNTGMPNAGIMNIGNQAAAAMGAGYSIAVTPNGGKSGRDSNGDGKVNGPGDTKNHPSGNAMDSYLTYNGRRATPAEQTTFLANARNLGATGASCYSSGFCHIDNLHKSPVSSWTGDAQSRNAFNNPDKYASDSLKGKKNGVAATDPAAKSQDGSQQDAAAPGGQSQPCSQDGGSSGCAPASTAAPQAAASLAQNQGMQMPTSLSGALQAVGGTALGGASQLVSQAAAMVGGSGSQILNQAMALAAPALAAGGNATSMITQAIGSKIAGMGAGNVPGIVGNIATDFIRGGATGLAGMAQGLVTDKINSFAQQLLGSSSPQLGQFMNMFSAASGAAGMANQYSQTMNASLSQTFGNAGSLFRGEGLAVNNLSKLPGGADPLTNQFLNLEIEELNGQVREGIDNTFNLIGEPSTIIDKLVNTDLINAFGSVNRNWGSLATAGFGNLTNDLTLLGIDLKRLGNLADVRDTFRMGTPGQIAQQLIAYNSGYVSGLSDFLSMNQLTLADLSNANNDELMAEFLGSVVDPDVIETVKQNLSIHPDIVLETLGDLLDPTIIFPNSYEFNYFENLNDIAVHLSLCNDVGNIKNLLDLGNMFESFEVPYELTELYGDATPYNMSDMIDIRDYQLPTGRYHPDGELTVADFIGTAAGYVHSQTLPVIAATLEELYQNTSYLDAYGDYMVLLAETLSGNYSTLIDVTVPGFGIYTTLDDAVSDIVDAIEADLIISKEAMLADPDVRETYLLLEAMHYESTLSLLHEAKLRRAFGIEVGNAARTETYISDGATQTITLADSIGEDTLVNVFVSGTWQHPGVDFTINRALNKITLDSPPAAGTRINVQYGTGKSLPGNNSSIAWQFASNLENIALETGFGGPAEFLNRVLTDDEHGQRMKAIMIGARNKQRTRNFGLACPEWDKANNGVDSYINYITQTGIWNSDPTRSAEIWLQNTQDVYDSYNYQLKKLVENKDKIQLDIEYTLQNVMRQLVFFTDDSIAVTQLFVDIFQSETMDTIKEFNRTDLLIPYSDDLPTEGYILGNYNEIISEITSIEGMKNSNFTIPLSIETTNYLDSLGVDLKQVVTALQKVLLTNAYLSIGVSEGDYRAIFNVPSAAKLILQNIANNY